MSNVVNMRSALTMNSRFIGDFLSGNPPCFALGLVEEFKEQIGFLVLRPGEYIPESVSGAGFRFGHCLLGTSEYEIIQFVFEFYGFRTYEVLLNPNNPIVQTVLKTLVLDGDVFIFTMGINDSVSAFRTQFAEDDLFGLRANLPRILKSKTTDAQYREAVVKFEGSPESRGKLLNWVCRDDLSHLDLTQDRLELRPS